MHEIVSQRAENSKTFRLDNGRRQLQVSIGAIHYKNDYATDKDWLDIDLTWEGSRITKAPYELTLDGQKITLKDKKTGEVSILELTSVKPSGMQWQIIPFNDGLSFQHILPSGKIPFKAQFKVTGNWRTRAFDDEGELELESTLTNDVLTEKLSEVRDKETGKVRPSVGQIRIDPTLTVQPSAKDTFMHSEYPTNNYGAETYFQVRSFTTSNLRAILEFAIAWGTDIPAEAALNAATLGLYAYSHSDGEGRTYWAYRLTRTDWIELQATWNIYKTDFNWTTAGGDYTATDGASVAVPAIPNWTNWSVLAQAQYAQTNNINVEFLIKDGTEGADPIKDTNFYSNNYADDTTLRPKLVIEYTMAYTESASVSIGVVAPATRALTFARTSPVIVGILASATRAVTFTRASSVIVGMVATATRIIAATRASSIGVGVVASASRLLAATRTASVIIRVKAMASMLSSIARKLKSFTGRDLSDATARDLNDFTGRDLRP